MSVESRFVVTLPGTLTPEDYRLPNNENTLSVNIPPPAHAWFIVYLVDLGDREFTGEIVVIGMHPTLWVRRDAIRTSLRFFAEIPLDVALQWPNYADYRGDGNDDK